MVAHPNTLHIKILENGDVYFDHVKMLGMDILLGLLRIATLRVPRPEIHIVCTGDFTSLGKVVFQTQLADFPTENVHVFRSVQS